MSGPPMVWADWLHNVAWRPVTEGLGLGLFAAAEPQGLGLLGFVHHRHELGARVRPIAKRLFLTTPAGAPEVLLARFDGHHIGRVLRCNGVGHLALPSELPLYYVRRARISGSPIWWRRVVGTLGKALDKHKAWERPVLHRHAAGPRAAGESA